VIDALRGEGKVLHFGVSNFTPSQFRMLQSCLPFPIVTNQIEISLTCPEPLFNGDLDTLMEFRVSPMAWSPLGGGKTVAAGEREVFVLASRYNATYSQLAFAWLLKHPGTIFPIAGTTRPERLEEAARSIDIQLSRQDWFEMLGWVMKKEIP
jgi:predicted oxidoreductase